MCLLFGLLSNCHIGLGAVRHRHGGVLRGFQRSFMPLSTDLSFPTDSLIPFFSCCVYVCALVGVCACGHTYMHVHLEATSQPWLPFLRSYLAYFLQQGISLA